MLSFASPGHQTSFNSYSYSFCEATTWRFLYTRRCLKLWIMYQHQCYYSLSSSFILSKTFCGHRLLSLVFRLMEATTSKYRRANCHQPDRQPANRGWIPRPGTWLTLHALNYMLEAIIGLLSFHPEHQENIYAPEIRVDTSGGHIVFFISELSSKSSLIRR